MLDFIYLCFSSTNITSKCHQQVSNPQRNDYEEDAQTAQLIPTTDKKKNAASKTWIKQILAPMHCLFACNVRVEVLFLELSWSLVTLNVTSCRCVTHFNSYVLHFFCA